MNTIISVLVVSLSIFSINSAIADTAKIQDTNSQYKLCNKTDIAGFHSMDGSRYRPDVPPHTCSQFFDLDPQHDVWVYFKEKKIVKFEQNFFTSPTKITVNEITNTRRPCKNNFTVHEVTTTLVNKKVEIHVTTNVCLNPSIDELKTSFFK